MQPEKKHILIFIDWYKPGFKAGGPIQSCANLVDHLKDEFRFSIVTRNTDYGESTPYPNIIPNKWNEFPDGNRIFYLSASKLSFRSITSFITSEYSSIYLSSFFSWYFSIVPLLYARMNGKGPKIILGPRGMLGAGALQLKSFKKNMFLSFSKVIGLHNKVIWQASTDYETKEIKALFPNAKVMTAIDLPPRRELAFVHREKKAHVLKLFFLSRIAPKKNLIKVFDYLPKINRLFIVKLDIIGPVEDENYWKQCQEKIEGLNHHSTYTINYVGAVANEELMQKLNEYHFMILPTLNENFGHVILESFAAGCPVIISDQTPWRDLQSKQIGWDLALNDDATFVNALDEAAAMGQEQYDRMSKKAFETAQAYYTNKESVEQNRNLFRE